MKIRCLGLLVMFAISILSSTASEAGSNNIFPAYQPAFGPRSRPFLDVVEECRHRYFGIDPFVTAEWNARYGRTGWWCSYKTFE